MPAELPTDAEPRDFIRNRIRQEVAEGRVVRVQTRFPPEPSGYLHFGHSRPVFLDFGVASEFAGACTLRFDDTNPERESEEYVAAIQRDLEWLGCRWAGAVRYCSDYFPQIYAAARGLCERGLAYVCELTAEQTREYRGTLTTPGRDSPWRDRPVAGNLALLERMRHGEFADGHCVLRAKIDMASPNMNLRDPVLYRIRHVHHPRTGNDWPIYPSYDFSHPLSDLLEGTTYSLCSLEFEDHRPFYDWVIDQCGGAAADQRPVQIEFGKLNLDYTIMGKRWLRMLVEQGHVDGWDDPRMPTLAGMRRRGFPPAALRELTARIGLTKQDITLSMGVLEGAVRDTLESSARRGMAVLDPLPVVITNYPDGAAETLHAPWHPKLDLGGRDLPFGREVLIEREDFALEPPKKWKRLAPGGEVRLRYAYVIRCDEVVQDADGTIREIRASYFPDSKSGADTSGRKPAGVVHWVDAQRALPARANLYDRLFTAESPDTARLVEQLNPQSKVVREQARIEPALDALAPGDVAQFERLGYFCRDMGDAGVAGARTFNRTATLRDSWGGGHAD